MRIFGHLDKGSKTFKISDLFREKIQIKASSPYEGLISLKNLGFIPKAAAMHESVGQDQSPSRRAQGLPKHRLCIQPATHQAHILRLRQHLSDKAMAASVNLLCAAKPEQQGCNYTGQTPIHQKKPCPHTQIYGMLSLRYAQALHHKRLCSFFLSVYSRMSE